MTEYEKGWNAALNDAIAYLLTGVCGTESLSCEHMSCKTSRVHSRRLRETMVREREPSPMPAPTSWDADGREVAE